MFNLKFVLYKNIINFDKKHFLFNLCKNYQMNKYMSHQILFVM